VQYQLPGTPLEETVDRFYARIAHPAMTDVSIDFGGLEVFDVHPVEPPDLWAGRPVHLVGRLEEGTPSALVEIKGVVDGRLHRMRIPVDMTSAKEHEAVRQLWARQRIADIQWDLFAHAEEKRADITEVALEHHLVSPFTSLVAVENAPSTCGAAEREVAVEHYGPAGTRLENDGMSGQIGGLLGAKGTQASGGSLGSRGSGLGGGGTAAGLGGLGTHGMGSGASGYGAGGGHFGAKGAGAIGAVGGDPIIMGSLDRSLIDEVIKRHMNQIRYCYQRELNKTPQLAGKVVIKFVIGKDGSVASAVVKSSTLRSAIVEECVVGRFLRMQFPSSPGGGIVIVSYPFQFSPG
jgi:hypothetical protein